MQFFTRELYLRLTPRDDATIAGGEAEWEAAVTAYHAYLEQIAETMKDRVRKFALDLCLHDTEFLALQEDVVSFPAIPTPETPVAILSLRGIGRIYTLFYLLWGAVNLSTGPDSWPYSPLRLQWLYDEIEPNRENTSSHNYIHHIMLSNGHEMIIPFYDVIVHSYPEKSLEPIMINRKFT